MRHSQDGLTTIDLIFGLALGMMLLVGMLHVQTAFRDSHTAYLQGQRLVAGRDALQRLLEDQGSSIVTTGTAIGIGDAWSPSEIDLRTKQYLPTYANTQMPHGGVIRFYVRKGANNQLMGLACDSVDVMRNGQPDTSMASLVMTYTDGFGLRTNMANQTVLNGQAYQGILSPIAGPAIVCAWAFISNPI